MREARWFDAEPVTRDAAADTLGRWAQQMRDARVRAVYANDDGSFILTRAGNWTSVRIDTQALQGSSTATLANPVTVWSADIVPGEDLGDIVVCRQTRCTDISAAYVLGQFAQGWFPRTHEGLSLPQAAIATRVGMVQPELFEYLRSWLYQKRTIMTTSAKGGLNRYSELDAVFYAGHRRVAGTVVDCIGWFAVPSDVSYPDGRFSWFCQHPAGILAATPHGDQLVSVRSWHGTTYAPPPAYDLVNLIPMDARAALPMLVHGLPDSWIQRHKLISPEGRLDLYRLLTGNPRPSGSSESKR